MKSKKTFLSIIVLITALFLATVAAGFSIYGISRLFSTYFIPIIIMGIAIELGKIVLISYSYQRWKFISWPHKMITILLIILAVSVTSIGIYGFLSSSYEKTASELNIQDSRVSLLEKRKTKFLTEIQQSQSQIDIQNQRVTQLINVRLQQEERLNQLYSDSSIRSARTTENLIKKADIDIDSANNKINVFSKNISNLNDSIFKIDEQIVELKSKSTTTDLGPLKYLSRLSAASMDKTINWFILLLMTILDPVAIYLLVGFNQLILDREKISEEKLEKKNRNHYIKITNPFKKKRISNDIIPVYKSNTSKEVFKDEKEKIIEHVTPEKNVNELFNEFKASQKKKEVMSNLETPLEPLIKEKQQIIIDPDAQIHAAGGIRP